VRRRRCDHRCASHPPLTTAPRDGHRTADALGAQDESDEHDSTPLFAAAALEPTYVPELVELFPEAASVPIVGASPSRFTGMLPLHAACAGGDVEAIRALLDAFPGAASTCDGTGCLPHHWAARTGQLNALKLLMAQHAEGIRHEDDEGVEPIDEALRFAAASARAEPLPLVPDPTQPRHVLLELMRPGGHPGGRDLHVPVPHPRDELIAYLIGHNMPVTLDGLLADHGNALATGWDAAHFHHPGFQGPDPYDCAAALTIVLADESKGGYGFYRRARLLKTIAELALQVSRGEVETLSTSVQDSLAAAVRAQPSHEAAADARNWRNLRAAALRQSQ
jgi:hypothetical protein